MPGTKPQAIPFEAIEWGPSEWAAPEQEGLTAVVEGHEFNAFRQVDEENVLTKRWAWMITATATASETPEIIESGTAASQSGAQYACKERFNQYRLNEWRRRSKEMAEAIKANAAAEPTLPEPDEPEEVKPTGGEMLAAVENQVRKATRPKRSRKAVAA